MVESLAPLAQRHPAVGRLHRRAAVAVQRRRAGWLENFVVYRRLPRRSRTTACCAAAGRGRARRLADAVLHHVGRPGRQRDAGRAAGRGAGHRRLLRRCRWTCATSPSSFGALAFAGCTLGADGGAARRTSSPPCWACWLIGVAQLRRLLRAGPGRGPARPGRPAARGAAACCAPWRCASCASPAPSCSRRRTEPPPTVAPGAGRPRLRYGAVRPDTGTTGQSRPRPGGRAAPGAASGRGRLPIGSRAHERLVAPPAPPLRSRLRRTAGPPAGPRPPRHPRAARRLRLWGTSKLTINSNQLDLISQDLPEVKEVKRVIDMVGGSGYLMLALRSYDEATLKRVADDLAAAARGGQGERPLRHLQGARRVHPAEHGPLHQDRGPGRGQAAHHAPT